MGEKNTWLRGIWRVAVGISITVTIIIGFFLVTNFQNIAKMLEVAAIVKTQYLHDIPLEQMMDGAVRGMVKSLEDPYSVYLDKEEYEDFAHHIEGSIGGIGVSVGVEEDRFVVFSVIEKTPAEAAGMKKGDIIYKVNNALTSEMDLDEAVNKMRGEPGTTVQISVLRDGQLREFNITRAVIDLPTVENFVLEEEQIGVIQVNLFASNTDEALEDNLQEVLAKGVKGLVLDLRDNPGGDLQSAINMAKFFLPEGPIVHIVDRFGMTETIENKEPQTLKMPLVVLLNGGSASASEVLAGAIKDHGTGTIIGEKSFGKALVQALIPMRGGDAIKLTTAKYLTPKKVDIQAEGIHPDIEVVLSETDTVDTQLSKAVEVLRKQINDLK